MNLFLLTPLLGLLSGCILFGGKTNAPATGTAMPATQGSSIQGSLINSSAWLQSLTTMLPENASNDEVWAISGCNCTPYFTERYERSLALRPGALPEILVPTIREELRNNSELKLITSLKGDFGAIARKMFADDSLIAQQIRDGVAKKIQTATSWGASLAVEKFRFSPFPAPTISGPAALDWSRFFSVSDQAVRWNFVFSHDGMWEGITPSRSSDHGFQLLNVMLVLSEWEYIFGLSHDPNGNPYGGLTLSTKSPSNGGLRDFDPRLPYETPRFISGKYAVLFQEGANAVDTALNSREVWTNVFEGLYLDEQARVWISAAKIFHRTRPRNRTYTNAVFSPVSGALPDETHFLPLVVMPSLEQLLANRFIDEKSRKISTAITNGANTNTTEISDSKRLLAITRLLEALRLWHGELSWLEDVSLSRELGEKLKSAPPTLKLAAQLLTQTILVEYVTTTAAGSDDLKMLVAKDSPPLTAAEAAEVIATLAKLEKTTLPSDFLHAKIGRLADWFANEYLRRSQVDQTLRFSPSDLFWTATMFAELNGEATKAYALPWLIPSATELNTILKNWDNSL